MNTRGVVLEEVVLMQAAAGSVPALAQTPKSPLPLRSSPIEKRSRASTRSVAVSPRGQGLERRVERAAPGSGKATAASPKSMGVSEEEEEEAEEDEEEVLMVAPKGTLSARSGGLSPKRAPPQDAARAALAGVGLDESTDEVLMIRPPHPPHG